MVTGKVTVSAVPGLGKKSNRVTIDLEVPGQANGVLYALGGSAGGLTVFMQDGKLTYEYNMMLIENYSVTTPAIAAGRHEIEITTNLQRPGAEAEVQIKLDGKKIANCVVARSVPAAFSATETFDVGKDLGSPVSLRYRDKAPFAYNGQIHSLKVALQ